MEDSKDRRSVGGHGNQHVRLRIAQVSETFCPAQAALCCLEPWQASGSRWYPVRYFRTATITRFTDFSHLIGCWDLSSKCRDSILRSDIVALATWIGHRSAGRLHSDFLAGAFRDMVGCVGQRRCRFVFCRFHPVAGECPFDRRPAGRYSSVSPRCFRAVFAQRVSIPSICSAS